MDRWANPKFIFLMFGTTFLDWLLSLVIGYNSWRFWRDWKTRLAQLEPGERTKRQKAALVISIVSNLTMLGFFKYFNFFLDTYNGVVTSAGAHNLQWDTFFRVILPLGISFYTFQSLSYIIDVYRGEAKAMRNFVDFSCFVSMFPHLVAGPILKFSFLADQLEKRSLTIGQVRKGRRRSSCSVWARRFCWPIHAERSPTSPSIHTPFTRSTPGSGRWPTRSRSSSTFSAYSDMAIGLGLMLRLCVRAEFRLAVPLTVDHRVLAPLAHFAVDLAARISVHPARGQPEGQVPHVT